MTDTAIELFEMPADSGGRQSSDVLFQSRPAHNPDFVRYRDRADAPVAFVHRRVFETLGAESQRALPNETIGVLIGRVCRDEYGTYVLVMAAEPAIEGEYVGTPGGVRISVADRAALVRRATQKWCGWEIVGWWHSHPHGVARFSQEDFTEQKAQGPRHVGIVVAVEQYAKSGRDGPAEAFGVYFGQLGYPLSPLNWPIIRNEPRSPIPPAIVRDQPSTVLIGRQIAVAVGVLLVAILATGWWTQQQVGANISTQVTQPSPAVIKKVAIVTRPLTLMNAQTCPQGETISLHIATPGGLLASTIAFSDNPSIAIASLSADASRLNISCLSPGTTTVWLVSNPTGSRTEVRVIVPNTTTASRVYP